MDGRPALAPLTLVVLLLAGAVVLTPAFRSPPADSDPGKGPADVKIVTVSSESEAKLWPYTSRRRTFESLTLPINVVVQASPRRTRGLLMANRTRDWQPPNETDRTDESGGGLEWQNAHGARRWTYVHATDERGGWRDETAELHSGTYLGQRLHLRLYAPGPEASWTAIQAHREHWDWFRLRHTVTSLARARSTVETEFRGRPLTNDIWRERYANGGIMDSDGWVSVVAFGDDSEPTRVQSPSASGSPRPSASTSTRPSASTSTRPSASTSTHPSGSAFVRLPVSASTASSPSTDPSPTDTPFRSGIPSIASIPALAALLVLFSSVFDDGDVAAIRRAAERLVEEVARPETRRLTALAAALALIPVAVRLAAVWVELAFPGLPPKAIAAVGYPILAAGLPLSAYVLPRRVPEALAATVAAAALGVGLLVDYVVLGVTLLPVAVVAHRVALLFAIGLVAVAGARATRDDAGGRSTRSRRRAGTASEGSRLDRFAAAVSDALAAREPVAAVAVVIWIAMLAWPLFLSI